MRVIVQIRIIEPNNRDAKSLSVQVLIALELRIEFVDGSCKFCLDQEELSEVVEPSRSYGVV